MHKGFIVDKLAMSTLNLFSMKSKITFLLLFTAMCTQSYAQLFDWVSTGGYVGVANSYHGTVDIARDSQGNLYTMDIGNAPQQCQNQTAAAFDNSQCTFLYKFNSAGVLIYMKPIGYITPLNLEVDDDDNLYFLGANGDNNVIKINDLVVPAVVNRNYVFKLSPTGELVWAVPAPLSFGNWPASSMMEYANGYLYFQTGAVSIGKLSTEGDISETLTADAYTSITSSTGLCFNGSGTFSNGDLLFAALSRGTVTYGDTVLAPAGNTFLTMPLLFMRCTPNLEIVWVGYFDGYRDPDMDFIPVAIANDDVYATVQVNSQATAGPDTIINPPGTTSTNGIIKIDGAGNGVWLKPVGGTVHPWDIIKVADGSGLYITGQLSTGASTGQFGEVLLDAGANRCFVAKIDYSGNFTNAFAFGGDDVYRAQRLASDNDGTYFAGGRIDTGSGSGTAVFSCQEPDSNNGFYLGKFIAAPDTAPQPVIEVVGNQLVALPEFSGAIQWFLDGVALDGENDEVINVTESGTYSVTYTMLTGCMNTATSAGEFVLSVNGSEKQDIRVRLYPNPSNGQVTLSFAQFPGTASLTITDANGRTVSRQSIGANNDAVNLSKLSAGVYFFYIESNEGSTIKRMVKI